MSNKPACVSRTRRDDSQGRSEPMRTWTRLGYGACGAICFWALAETPGLPCAAPMRLYIAALMVCGTILGACGAFAPERGAKRGQGL